MKNSIQLYTNENFSVRTTQDADGTVWFVARDIAEALEYSLEGSITSLFANVPAIWSGRKRIAVRSSNGIEQEREMLCLTEQGVYFFLGRSDKKKALPYQMWIAGEVVPSIRRTGNYSVHSDNPALPAGVLEGAKLIFETAGIKDNQLTLAMDKVYRSYTGRSALETGDVKLLAPAKEQLLTPTEIGHQLGLSARRINELLAYGGFQHNLDGKWEPIGDGLNYAVMQDTNKRHSNGTPVRQLKWQSGIISVIEKMLKASTTEVEA